MANGDRRSKDSSTASPVILPANRHDSFFSPNGNGSSSELGLAYYDPLPSNTLPVIDLTEGVQDFQSGSSSSAARSSLRVPRTGFRPASTYTPPPALEPSPSELLEDAKPLAPIPQPAPPGIIRPGELRTLSFGPSRSSRQSLRSRSVSPQSARSSQAPLSHHTRQSTASTRELPPLPPSAHPTPPSTPPPHSLRQASPFLLSPQASLRSPRNAQSNVSSPSSKVSLAPSEGEDMDGFHVRHTYAVLEVSGVKGDGYEEGVERTRARIGNSRQSQLNADAAIGDGSEKFRDLDPKEIQLLASVDRYGFFSIPSHDRLILLNAAPLTKRLSRVSAGPPSVSAAATSLRALPTLPKPLKESRRIAKWTRMLQAGTRDAGGNIEMWRIRPSKESKLRERVYKGIPDRWRGAAWDLLLTRFAKMGHQELMRLGEEYRDGLDKPSKYDVQIDLDVPRTISGHIMFKTRYGAGQRSLFHVLHSFSLRCATCGYVQGMGPIAATLLCYFEPERVYASLVRLHDAYNMHTVFSPGFPGLLEAIYIQERIIEQMMPDVYQAFKKHMISTMSYATKWYITLFANSVPFQTQLRLWDAFLLEGYDLFVAVAVGIVWVYRDHITSSAANFETVLSLLSSFFVPEDENLFLTWISKALGDKKLRANINKWRADWKRLVAEGKDGAALL
ncbi:RabGAP/TBC [Macrolepiota fuliginosa MF-IS2]|uniref:RabGAP/TBC n=1 Tax=Macrolepiota fuliginosa MF-IS2 TaxID=1400762 RepID=A0A9P5X8Y0_9AGAR|nr:RabGAP/TBC [Macrolepiota fuliginosa MF-IS2]